MSKLTLLHSGNTDADANTTPRTPTFVLLADIRFGLLPRREESATRGDAADDIDFVTEFARRVNFVVRVMLHSVSVVSARELDPIFDLA